MRILATCRCAMHRAVLGWVCLHSRRCSLCGVGIRSREFQAVYARSFVEHITLD